MTTPIEQKTDAELARFCAVQSDRLTRLQSKIEAAKEGDPELNKEFDHTAAELNAAIDELQNRTDLASRTTL